MTTLLNGNYGTTTYTTTEYAPTTQYEYVQQGPTQYVQGATQYVQGGTQYVQGATQYLQGSTAGATYTTVPGATTYTTTEYVSQPLTATLGAVGGGIASSQIGGEVIKGQSRIEYIPFEQRVTDYETREWTEVIPKQRTVTEYQERRYTETVPREVTKVDYYAIEYLKQYIPQVIPETTVETIPVERVVQRTEYIPVERKIVHYPETPLAVEYQQRVNQGISIGNVGQVVTTSTAPVVTGSTTYVTGSRVGGGQIVTGGTQYVTGGTQYVTGGTQLVGGSTQYVTGGQLVSSQLGGNVQYVTSAPQTVQYVTSAPQNVQYVTSAPQNVQYVTGISGSRLGGQSYVVGPGTTTTTTEYITNEPVSYGGQQVIYR